ncbi:MAG TPA: hypothetical protein VM325_02620 [Alphaproteobacteria bacterium]|nr:hypothetical protein [Alphaproteobacteria bacterium]
MTAPGARLYDATGRSVSERKASKHTKIEGPFVAHLYEMLKSPAYRALSLTAHRILTRLEIEHGDHSAYLNGHLVCTYTDFQWHGARRNSITMALRELEALGFIEIVEHGRAGNREYRRPSIYRLTFLSADACKPTHEWRRIKTDAEAAEAIAKARKIGGDGSQKPPKRGGK